MHNQHYLNNYFSHVWSSNIDQYKYSGRALIDKIAPGELVLDVGCGPNFFKEHIPNLVGIDPAFDQADYQTTIEDFKTDCKFDVVFCLGSINFGTADTIKNQIKCVVNLLKPDARVYWRCNPGRSDHGNTECANIDFFPWSQLLLTEYANQFGFEIVTIDLDLNNRIYAEWTRSNT